MLSVSLVLSFSLSYLLKVKDKYHQALGLGLINLLLVYAFAPRISFHYLLWATPLIILYFKNLKTVSLLIFLQGISLASYKLLVNHLQAGLFSPLNTDYFSSLPAVNEIINKYIPYAIISGIGFFIFLLVNIIVVVRILIYLLFQSSSWARR